MSSVHDENECNKELQAHFSTPNDDAADRQIGLQ
jgi:hypothetical protein